VICAGAAASQSAASVHMGLLAGRAAAAPAASGVATTVLGAMGTHPKNAGVQLAGCHALWSLAYKVRAQTNYDLCCGLAIGVVLHIVLEASEIRRRISNASTSFACAEPGQPRCAGGAGCSGRAGGRAAVAPAARRPPGRRMLPLCNPLSGISICDIKFYVWAVWWQGCAALASLAVDDAVAQQVAALGGSAIVMAVRSRIDDFGLALALSGC